MEKIMVLPTGACIDFGKMFSKETEILDSRKQGNGFQSTGLQWICYHCMQLHTCVADFKAARVKMAKVAKAFWEEEHRSLVNWSLISKTVKIAEIKPKIYHVLEDRPTLAFDFWALLVRHKSTRTAALAHWNIGMETL